MGLESDTRGHVLASLAQALELFTASALAGFFIIRFASHLLAKSTPFAKLAEAADRLLDGLTGTHP
jgi:hypothetical protein